MVTVALGLNTPDQVDAAVAAAHGEYPDLSLVERLASAVSAQRPVPYGSPPYRWAQTKAARSSNGQLSLVLRSDMRLDVRKDT